MQFNKIFIYRITHIDNIPHIFENGITHKEDKMANPNYKSIGDLSLIDNRLQRKVQVDNGDYLNLNAPEITLGDFIPFYFGVRMPMLYVIQHGGNFVLEPISPENIVYLACHLQTLTNNIKNYYFTDGHAVDSFTSFYDPSRTGNISDLIDWKAVKTKYWGGNENLNAKRKKQAEFLSGERISAKLITGFACYNSKVKIKFWYSSR